jgi:hypothetical protein
MNKHCLLLRATLVLAIASPAIAQSLAPLPAQAPAAGLFRLSSEDEKLAERLREQGAAAIEAYVANDLVALGK